MSKKKKLIFIIITAIVLIVIISSFLCFYLYNNNLNIKHEKEIYKQNKSSIKEYKEEVKYNTTWAFNDLEKKLINKKKLAKNTKIKFTINDKLFKDGDTYTFKLGQTKIEVDLINNYTYKIFKEESKIIENKKEVIITVVDKDAPILEGVTDKTITVGDKLDLISGIKANDEVDGVLSVKVDGEVDTNKAGTYKVKIYAVDKSGNKAEKEMTIVVNDKVVQETNTNFNPSYNNSTYSNGYNNSNSSSNSPGNNSYADNCQSRDVLRKRGYNGSDPSACEKDKQASAIARQIANDILSRGYAKDIEKVEAAATIVSDYYGRGVHVESGYDYRTPYGVFVKGEASCAGCTRALILVLQYMGFTNLTHANENGYTHQWVILTMDGQKGFADGQVGLVGYGCHFVDDSCN